jgi:hypothetical protein
MPGGRSTMAAKTCQPAISADPGWAAKTAGSKPAVSVSLWGTSPGRSSSGTASDRAGILRHLPGAGRRGPAPSAGLRIFLLPASGVRRVVCTLQSQPVPEVLQLILPSGFAAGDRTRTAVATASAAGSTATAGRSVPRALSWLTGMATAAPPFRMDSSPRSRKGRQGLGSAPGPPFFLRFRILETRR